MIYITRFFTLWSVMKSETLLSLDTLKEIVETSVDAVIVINYKGIIQYVNQATIFLFLYQKQDLIGQNISILMPQPHQAQHDSYLSNYHTTGKRKIIGIGREVKAKKKSGETFACLLSISEVCINGDKLFTGILHDISALKAAEENLIELNKSLENKVFERTEKLSEVVNRLLATNSELSQEIDLRKKVEEALTNSEEELKLSLNKEKELSELKSRFVTMASHEFRTPLSTILSSSNLIDKYAELEQFEKITLHIQKIKATVTHLTGILNDFLSLGKWEEGKVTIEYSEFEWLPFISNLVGSMDAFLKPQQSIKLDTEACILNTDANILRNSLINLLSNASKYSAAGKTITVKNFSKQDGFVIQVIDEGQGIPLSEQKNIFERFYRASNVVNIEGTGIGLNLVKSYITEIKGKVYFESHPDKGSIFTIEIPKL